MMIPTSETAVLGAGCFWGVEEAFRTMKGVVDTEVGYSGGKTLKPTYEEVSTGKTGHAESVRVVYDPDIISYEDILAKFWEIHDPTQVNRQGLDIGTQYRSVIFFQDEAQKKVALESKEYQQTKLGKKVVTEIIPKASFYPAEEYHQKYVMKTGDKTCH